MKRVISSLAVAVLPAMGGAQDLDTCLVSSNERLTNKCLLERIDGQQVTIAAARLIDGRLKFAGYRDGLGLAGKGDRWYLTGFVAPTLAHFPDLNGGNPDKPLTIGNLTFTGDPDLARKSGVAAGASLRAVWRGIYGEGRYLEGSIQSTYVRSLEHDLWIGSGAVEVCSNNHIYDWWYIDACASTSKVRKELTDDQRSALNFSISKLVSNESTGHHEISADFRRVFEDRDYAQNQIGVGIDTIHLRDVYSAVRVSLGEPVEDFISLRHSATAAVSTLVGGRPLTASLAYVHSKGGPVLGHPREEDAVQATVSYRLASGLDVYAGFRSTESTIDYYDVDEPIFGVRFSAVRF